MARTGGVKFKISADPRGLHRGLGQAQRSVDGFGKGISKLGALGGGGLAGMAAGLVSVGGAASLIKDSTNATMDLYKASLQLGRITGMDVAQSSAWVSLAKERGIEANRLSINFTTLAKQIRAAQGGSEKATRAFTQLGVSQQDIARGDTATIVGKIADSLSKHADGSGKAALGSQMFGRSYAPLLGLLNKGGPALRAQIADQLKYGATLTGNTNDLAKARESQLKFNQTIDRLKIMLGRQLLPVITGVADKMTAWLRKPENQAQLKSMVNSFISMAKQLGAIAKSFLPVINAAGRFTAKHPDIVRMVGTLIAMRMAIRLISFANPVRGIIGFGRRISGLGALGSRAGAGIAAGLGRAWPRASAALNKWRGGMSAKFGAFGFIAAAAFVATAGPKIVGDMTTIMNSIQGGNNAGGAGKGLFRIGATILGGVAGFALGGPAGMFVGAGIANQIAGPAAGALGIGNKAKGRRVYPVVLRRAGQPDEIHNFNTKGEADAFAKQARRSSRATGASTMPAYTAPATDTPGARKTTGGKAKATPASKLPGKLLGAANAGLAVFAEAKARVDEADTRMWARGIDPNSAKGAKERMRRINSALSTHKSVRGKLHGLARQAAKQGLHSTVSRILSMIRTLDHDAMELEAQRNEARAQSKDSTVDTQALLDETNRRLSNSQNKAAAEGAFIRAAFTAGDIGAGGRNAWAAAGGQGAGSRVMGGANVNVTINSLTPGDSKTQSVIAKTVVKAVGGQGSTRRPRATTHNGKKRR